MKRTIASLLIVICALLTTSFVLPAGKEQQVQQSRQRLDYAEIEIKNYAGSGLNFMVVFKSLTTGEEYSFELWNGYGATGGLPIDTYQISLSSGPTNYTFRLDACWDYTYNNGPALNSMPVGPNGCTNFTVSYYPN